MTTDSWPDDGDGDTSGYEAFDEPPLDEDGLDLTADDPADDYGDDGYDLDAETDAEPGDSSDDPATTDDVEPIETEFAVETINDEVIGSDPDAVDYGEADDYQPQFPPELTLDPMPEPVDGQPWSDADLLGDTADTTSWNTLNYTPVADDLLAMDASDSGWDALLASSDPAVSSLARWWQA